MPRPALPALPKDTVVARLPDGRTLIAYLDPAVPDHHSPLRRALRLQHPFDSPTATEATDGQTTATGTIRGKGSPDKRPPVRHD
jgi:hypothetical protein